MDDVSIKNRMDYIQKHGAVEARAKLVAMEKEVKRRKKVLDIILMAEDTKSSDKVKNSPDNKDINT